MNKYVSRGLWTVLVTGGFMALGIGAANADTGTSGQDGIASGTQGVLGIELPIQLGGNAISVLGDASSDGAATSAPSSPAAAPSGSTDGGGSVAGGSQLLADLGVPIQLSGTRSRCSATPRAADPTPRRRGRAEPRPHRRTTDGEDGVLSGTQVLGDLGLPVTLGGNAISVLGDASTSDADTSGSADGAAGDSAGSTDGADGILGGSQVLADLGVPVTLGGNAISVLGDASSDGASTASGSTAESDQEGSTSGSRWGAGWHAAAGRPGGAGDAGRQRHLGARRRVDRGIRHDDHTGPTRWTRARAIRGDPVRRPRALRSRVAAVASVSALAATGVDGGLTALAMALLLLAAGIALVLAGGDRAPALSRRTTLTGVAARGDRDLRPRTSRRPAM